MKNIHLIPTDKPSRLWKNNLLQGKLELSKEALPFNTAQNLYITSDEEIKEGDWVITNNGLLAKVITELTWHFINSKKIILTTDPDIIKDGVQSIDNEFLEWFVNNPSCEEIEVVDDTFTVGEMSKLPLGTRNHKYKIIIPKEETKQSVKDYEQQGLEKYSHELEPKQDYEYIGECKGNDGNGCFLDNCGHDCGCFVRKPKQETLEKIYFKNIEEYADSQFNKQETIEEAAKRHTRLQYPMGVEEEYPINDFIAGAKWQAKKMYSQEEVIELLKKAPMVFTDKWFEQFKKK